MADNHTIMRRNVSEHPRTTFQRLVHRRWWNDWCMDDKPQGVVVDEL
jgi:hypothetical protein